MTQHSTPITEIVVRLPNWIGDVCMVLPSLCLLADTGVPLTLCGKPFASTLVKDVPNHRFIAFEGAARADARTLRKHLGVRDRNRRGLLYPDSLTSALAFRLSGVPSLGYRDDGRSLLLRWPIDKPDVPMHAVLKWYTLTQAAFKTWQLPGMDALPETPPNGCYKPDREAQTTVDSILHDTDLNDAPFILIAPTATGLHKGQIKVWPHFEALTQALQARKIRVVACPPAHEREQALQAAPSAEILDPLDLDAFCALAQRAALVICNDSGVSHLAAIADAPQLTLFGVTDPAHTGPWSDKACGLGAPGNWPQIDAVVSKALSLFQSIGNQAHDALHAT